MEAREENGRDDHDDLAARAEDIALETSWGEALE